MLSQHCAAAYRNGLPCSGDCKPGKMSEQSRKHTAQSGSNNYSKPLVASGYIVILNALRLFGAHFLPASSNSGSFYISIFSGRARKLPTSINTRATMKYGDGFTP